MKMCLKALSKHDFDVSLEDLELIKDSICTWLIHEICINFDPRQKGPI